MSERFVYHRLSTTAGIIALVGGRVFPDVAPTKTPRPYVTFQRISTPRIRDLQGPANLAYPRFQIDAWADSRDSAKQVIDAVRVAFDGHSGSQSGVNVRAVSAQDESAEIDAETGLYRARLDAFIWHEE